MKWGFSILLSLSMIGGEYQAVMPDTPIYRNTKQQYLAQNEEAEQGNLESDEEEDFEIISVGDIMMHSDQIASGYRASTGSYDYNEMFEVITPYLEKADLTVGNLEFTMAGAEKGYSGYPEFNAPSEIADALKNAGFDILSTANNHSLDRRFYGVEHTIDVLDNRGILHTGTYKTKAGSEKILISKAKETAIAFLSYTYGTNGIRMEGGKEFSVNLNDEEKIKADIEKSRKQGAELVSVSIHFGDEYEVQPNQIQKQMVDFLVESGADIILGGHPHVLEPMEIRTVSRDGKQKEVVILYSQGNFISGQRSRYTDTGAIFSMKFTKNLQTKEIQLRELTYMPTWVDVSKINGRTQFRVLPAKMSIHAYEAGSDPLISTSDYEKLRRGLNDARQILQNSNPKIKEAWMIPS